MRAGVIFTGTGPILILTTYSSFGDGNFVEKLNTKGISKFLAYEVPIDLVKKRYGRHFDVIIKDVSQEDDLRILDFDGHRVFYNFSFDEMGDAYYHEEK